MRKAKTAQADHHRCLGGFRFCHFAKTRVTTTRLQPPVPQLQLPLIGNTTNNWQSSYWVFSAWAPPWALSARYCHAWRFPSFTKRHRQQS